MRCLELAIISVCASRTKIARAYASSTYCHLRGPCQARCSAEVRVQIQGQQGNQWKSMFNKMGLGPWALGTMGPRAYRSCAHGPKGPKAYGPWVHGPWAHGPSEGLPQMAYVSRPQGAGFGRVWDDFGNCWPSARTQGPLVPGPVFQLNLGFPSTPCLPGSMTIDTC